MRTTENQKVKRKIAIYHKRFIRLNRNRKIANFIYYFIILITIFLVIYFAYFIIELIMLTPGSDLFSVSISIFITSIIFASGQLNNQCIYINKIEDELYEICLFLEEHNVLNSEEEIILEKFIK